MIYQRCEDRVSNQLLVTDERRDALTINFDRTRRVEVTRNAIPHSRGLLSRGRLDRESKDKLDLKRLRSRFGEKPRTKAGQVRQAWPEIKALFEAGHSLKDICTWLNEIGYARLSHYTGQLKRRDATVTNRAPDQLASSKPQELDGAGADDQRSDPLANVREREERQPGFRFNSEPDGKKLI